MVCCTVTICSLKVENYINYKNNCTKSRTGLATPPGQAMGDWILQRASIFSAEVNLPRRPKILVSTTLLARCSESLRIADIVAHDLRHGGWGRTLDSLTVTSSSIFIEEGSEALVAGQCPSAGGSLTALLPELRKL